MALALTQLPDYTGDAPRANVQLPAPRVAKDLAQITAAIDARAKINGLTIDHRTLRDGNCGPDAILRNLERLQPANDKSSNILGLLAKSDRHIAIKAMRLMLLIWIQANRSQELLEGSTIEQFRRWMARASVRTQPACARWAAGSTL